MYLGSSELSSRRDTMLSQEKKSKEDAEDGEKKAGGQLLKNATARPAAPDSTLAPPKLTKAGPHTLQPRKFDTASF